MNKIDTTPKVLGLDISTKTIGWALFAVNMLNTAKKLKEAKEKEEEMEAQSLMA